ncbi:MarR family winged helix-turn-helix transcriptional regulator [Mangrovicoccus algicola]|uniref:Winged helix-turn-helix transcriptional regulator n=1 Tax=Mangrovicoccus algicola TaxID=2771008 RepID=A0A8J6YQC5_9RHOB|nr:MarR family winged helix-turn-helix transcriptional regulator [Mangrovicoccus algicola]MBE3637608.1 winged helix-turn-helix transcriptional regulator [Mangrovicoccus algicola]
MPETPPFDRSRLPAPTKRRDGTEILDLDTYAPFLVNALGGAWQRLSSADYRKRFGIGMVEWRVMAMLAIEPGITAARICQVIRMDKAAASRALADLDGKGHLEFEADESDPRKRRWRLSAKGTETHAAVLEAALGHEARMVDGVGPEEFGVFLAVLRRMLANLDPQD